MGDSTVARGGAEGRRRRARAGYSLPELILGAAVVASFLVAVFAIYSTTSRDRSYRDFVSEVYLVGSQVQESYVNAPDYASIKAADIAPALPSRYVSGLGATATLHNVYKETVSVAPYGADNSGFVVKASLPSELCQRAATTEMGRNQLGVMVGSGAMRPLPLKPTTDVGADCSKDASTQIAYVFADKSIAATADADNPGGAGASTPTGGTTTTPSGGTTTTPSGGGGTATTPSGGATTTPSGGNTTTTPGAGATTTPAGGGGPTTAPGGGATTTPTGAGATTTPAGDPGTSTTPTSASAGSVPSYPTLTPSDAAKACPTGITTVGDGKTVTLPTCDGTMLKGADGDLGNGLGGNGKAVTLNWGAGSGNAESWIYNYDNNSSPSTMSTLNLTGLNPSDVTFLRVSNPQNGGYYNSLQVVDNATGKSITFTYGLNGPGDGIGRFVFADGTVLTKDQVTALAVVDVACTGSSTPVPDGSTAILPTCDGGYVKGADGDFGNGVGGNGKAIDVVWSAKSGNASTWFYNYDNNSSPGTESKLTLNGLNPSDVTIVRVPNPQNGGFYNSMQVINNATGKTLTLTYEFNSVGDGVGEIDFADGTVMTKDQFSAIAVVRVPCTGYTGVPDGTTAVFGACDGGAVKGADGDFGNGTGGNGKGVNLAWGAGSGNGSAWIYNYDNNSSPGTTTTLTLTGLNPSDVAFVRVANPNAGGAYNSLQVIDKATGKTMTLTYEFSGNAGDGAGRFVFADGTVMTKAQVQAVAGVIPACGAITPAPDDGIVNFGACDGAMVKGGDGDAGGYGGGQGHGLTLNWGAGSGNAEEWAFDYLNSVANGHPSILNVVGLNPADVTITRSLDTVYGSGQYDNMTVTDVRTGKSIVITRQFSGNGTDGVSLVKFADGETLTAAQLSASAPVVLGCDGGVDAIPDDATVYLGACDGAQIRGADSVEYDVGGHGQGVNAVWGATSGNAESWIWSGDNNTPSHMSKVTLAGLTQADVTLSRVVDTHYGDGRTPDSLLITNKVTGKTMTITRQFSGWYGDGVASLVFGDGSTLTGDQVQAIVDGGASR